MQNDAFAAHSHTVSGTLYRQTESGDVSVHPVSGSFQRDNTESTLAGTAPETRMANVGVNYIIKR